MRFLRLAGFQKAHICQGMSFHTVCSMDMAMLPGMITMASLQGPLREASKPIQASAGIGLDKM